MNAKAAQGFPANAGRCLPQKASGRPVRVRQTGPAVRTEILRLGGKYNDIIIIIIIIDTGGRDTTSQRAALSVAHVLLVPFVPRSFDVWTLEKPSALIREMRTANPELIAYAFLNRADARGQDNEEAAGALQETAELRFLDVPLGARKAFSNAAAQGMAVTELRPPTPRQLTRS